MTTPANEHPWITVMRRKLRQRGFKADQIEKLVKQIVQRVPALREVHNEPDPHAALHRAINVSKKH
jgi:hypothetical protein